MFATEPPKYPKRELLTLFDVNSAVGEIAKQFKNTTKPWQGSMLFPGKGEYFWFDHWHYMTEAHQKIAERVYQSVK